MKMKAFWLVIGVMVSYLFPLVLFSQTPTPSYGAVPLRISDIEDAYLAQSRCNYSAGFVWRFSHAEYSSNNQAFGRITDMLNSCTT